VLRQAAMLSYNDTFLFLAIMFVLMIPLLFLLRRPKAGKGPAMMH
jgi:DHA2 family multidrug resistance protein